MSARPCPCPASVVPLRSRPVPPAGAGATPAARLADAGPAPAPAIPEPVVHILAPGQSLRIALRAGAVVHVQSGRGALIGAPRWVAEQYCRVRYRLAQGTVHVVQVAGWQTVAADGGGRLVLTLRDAPAPVPPPLLPGWLARLWVRLVGGLRG